MALGLVEQVALQIQLQEIMKQKGCEDTDKTRAEKAICEKGVDELIDELLKNIPPDQVCKDLELCVQVVLS